MKKSSIFENLVMNFSIDTEELSKTEEKKLKSVLLHPNDNQDIDAYLIIGNNPSLQ